ncbi:MAG: hypothetical protein BWZ10_02915 [candidate division BRC1 bacterium ADurb.BinA364]|nr:MAG: hypothetical protein BWZ10_02915 [candidate division BRC1 bacterium ADurb.BinA364]
MPSDPRENWRAGGVLLFSARNVKDVESFECAWNGGVGVNVESLLVNARRQFAHGARRKQVRALARQSRRRLQRKPPARHGRPLSGAAAWQRRIG